METYINESGKYDIVEYTDVCIVVKNKRIVFEGTYKECRRFIENQRKIGGEIIGENSTVQIKYQN